MTTRLEQIKARLTAATPGPWRSEGNGVSAPNSFVQGLYKVGHHASGRWGAKIPEPDAICVTCDEEYIENRNSGDVDLIAHAPHDLAALLRLAEAAERWEEANYHGVTITEAWAGGDRANDTRLELLKAVRTFKLGVNEI